MVATVFAVSIGLRYGTTSTLVYMWIRFVKPAK